MKAKQKRKKSLFFVKSSGQSTPGSQLSKRQPCCLPSEQNHGAYLRAVAISLHRHLPVPLWASAVAAPATDLRRQLCASSSLPAILPCLSRVVSLCHHKAPRSFPAMQNGGAQRLGSLLLCSMAALELCLNPVIKDGPQKQENKMSQLP